MIILNLMNLGIMTYTAYVNPLIGVLQNRVEIFNELLLCFIAFHMLFFTDWALGYDIHLIPDEKLLPDRDLIASKYLQESYGIGMACLVFFYLSINLSIILYFSLRSVRIVWIKYINLLNHKLGRTKKESEPNKKPNKKKNDYIKYLMQKEA